MPELSIIIVNFHTPKLTLACVDSILKSEPITSFEIILIDNESQGELKKSKSYRLLVNKKNLGLARAVNQGMRIAKGEYILLLNSDARIKKNTLDRLVEFARAHSDAGVVVPQLVNRDGTVQPSAYRLPRLGLAFTPAKLKKYVPQTQTVESAVMAAYLITPQARQKVGFLDEKYFLYYEDHDYSRRVKKAGMKIYYLPQAQVVHEHGASGGTNKLLIASAKKYHGLVGYYIYTLILWMGQKIRKFI